MTLGQRVPEEEELATKRPILYISPQTSTVTAQLGLPSYVDEETFLRLSEYSQRKMISLVVEPEEAPADLDPSELTKAGYENWTHYRIKKILEYALY